MTGEKLTTGERLLLGGLGVASTIIDVFTFGLGTGLIQGGKVVGKEVAKGMMKQVGKYAVMDITASVALGWTSNYASEKLRDMGLSSEEIFMVHLVASLSVMGYSKYKTNKVNINASDKKDTEIITDIERVRKAGVGKTGEGIPLEEVKPDVLKQIHPDDNGAYGYLPNEGTAYHKPEYDFTDADWAKGMQNVRNDYLEASKQLEIDIKRMTSEGFSKEDIAKHVVDARNQQKVTARANMTVEERAGLETRNIEIYGNPIGPDSQWLFNKTKKKLTKEGTYMNDEQIWEMVIKKSMVKDDVINTLLGLIH